MPPAGAIFFAAHGEAVCFSALTGCYIMSSRGEGPLRELDRLRPDKPHRWVPCSVLGPSGPPGGTSKGMRAPIGPLRIGFRPPPPAPTEGGRWLRTAAAPGLRPARHAVASPPWPSGPRLRWPRAIAACARPSLRRRPGPPLASLRPMGGSAGSGTRSSGRPRAAAGGPRAHPPRHSGLPPGPSAPEPRWVPPGRPRPRPALPRPSVGWPLWAGCGLRSSRPGPRAAQGAAFYGPRPRAFLRERQIATRRYSWVIQVDTDHGELSPCGGEPPQRPY